MVYQAFGLLFANMFAAVVIGVLSRNRPFTRILIFYSFILSIGGATTLYANPNLDLGLGPNLFGSDGEGYVRDAVVLSEFGFSQFQETIRSNYFGYQIYLAIWFLLFGSSLFVALFANSVTLMLSIFVLFRITTLLAFSSRAALLSCIAMMLTTVNIFYSLSILKDSTLGLGFGLILLAIAYCYSNPNRYWRPIVLFFFGAAIFVTMRGAMLPFIGVFLVSLFAFSPQRRPLGIFIMVVLVILVFPIVSFFTIYEFDKEFFVQGLTENSVISVKLDSGEVAAGGVVGRLSGDYLELHFFFKIIFFLLPTAIQFLLPFEPWSTAFLDEGFVFLFSRNLNAIWYLFVGVWVLYSVLNFRRIPHPLIRWFLVAGSLLYVAVAIVYGGAIPRYAVPGLLFIYPAVGYWWDRYLCDIKERRRVQVFFRGYYMTALVLGGVYILFLLYNLIL